MPITASIGLTQNSQSIDGNYSNVSGKITLSWSYGSWDHNNKTSTIKINGTTYSFTTPNINPSRTSSGSQTLYTKTVNVYHNTDGTKTVSASCSVPTVTSSGTVTASASKTLTTIPRASTPTRSAYSTNLGSAVTIYTNRASSSFTHTLTYKFGNASGTIATGVGTSFAWTIPKTLANQIPSATSGVGTIYCYTYSGSTHIGTKSVSFQAVVPNTAEFKPSISNLKNAETIAGLAAKFGGYVQNKSKVNASMSVSTAYGSSIVTKTITIDGIAYSGTNVTSATLKNSGTRTITYYAKDARRRTYSTSISIAVLAYANPSPTSLTAYRCDVNGDFDDKGNYAKVEVSASISPVGDNNDIAYRVKYKKTSDSAYTTLNLPATAYSIDTSVILSNIDINSRYNIVLEVQDYFMMVSREVVLPTAFTLMDFNADGTGIAFGKVSENSNELDVNLASKFRKAVRSTNKNDASLTSTDHAFQIGEDDGINLRMDNNEIMCLNNGVGQQLNINPHGGIVKINDFEVRDANDYVYLTGNGGTEFVYSGVIDLSPYRMILIQLDKSAEAYKTVASTYIPREMFTAHNRNIVKCAEVTNGSCYGYAYYYWDGKLATRVSGGGYICRVYGII